MHLQDLYQIANEYLIKKLVGQIFSEIERQSNLVFYFHHACDLLETAEMFELEKVKKDCLKYFEDEKNSRKYIEAKKILEERNISLESTLKVKSFLLKAYEKSRSNDAARAVEEIKEEFAAYDLEKYGISLKDD